MKKIINLTHIKTMPVIKDANVLAGFLASEKETKKFAGEMIKASHIHISTGNSKIGKCWNWSVTPLLSCTKEACRTCGVEGCYATTSYTQYPNTRDAWDENLWWVYTHLDEWKSIMLKWFSIVKPSKFRIHVAGDFLNVAYGNAWIEIMNANPDCQFFAFSKQWNVLRECKFHEVQNLNMRLSAWTGVTIPLDLMQYYEVAWVDDGIETRIPVGTYKCPGNCDTCGYYCVNQSGGTYFVKHGSDLKKGTARTKKRVNAA